MEKSDYIEFDLNKWLGRDLIAELILDPHPANPANSDVIIDIMAVKCSNRRLMLFVNQMVLHTVDGKLYQMDILKFYN